ncbi:VCBS repeat-containing protein, partial [Streptomyces sp. NPDC006288]|uniref:FG-GAP repeat domain-containing protein n=1 Tax=Streptomyces sp. NPDC006288 TaxID=3156743 RepID=UPI0033B1EF2B
GLLIYNAKSQSLWSAGTATRNDVNGDGRSDMTDWYDYGSTDNNRDALHVFQGQADGAIRAPYTAWISAGNQWDEKVTKKVNGDFNGDGISDIAVMYYYDSGQRAGDRSLWTYLGKGDGTYNSPFESWVSHGNRWGTFSRATLQAGDFNGDGRDDIAAWYDYADGSDKLWTFTADVRGGFNNPFASYTSATWTRAMSKLTVGDFNGDGRDDIGALYGYGATSVKLWTFQAQPTGGFAYPVVAWSHDSWGDWNRTYIHAGDFNGDGKDDIASWFEFADGDPRGDKIHTYVSLSSGDSKFASPKEAWSTGPGMLTYALMQMLPGDYNGDGNDDLAALYTKSDGTAAIYTWIAKNDGSATFNPLKTAWSSNWDGSKTTMIGRYTS